MKSEPLRVLILEDYQPAIAELKRGLAKHFSGAQLTIIDTTAHLAALANEPADRFDVILLDYYCAAGGNFHVAPLEKFGLKKVISISSTSGGNAMARARGITRVVTKHHHDLPGFVRSVIREIERLLPPTRSRRADEFASSEERSKKLRERDLIETFLARTTEFKGWKFSFYDENPDLVYTKAGVQLGFESVVVALNSNAADCYFENHTCTLYAPTPASSEQLERLRQAMVLHVLDHLRHYKIPTIIVLSVIGPPVHLAELARGLRLPELTDENIRDYYLCDARQVYKVAENKLP
ncbi:MAG: hypothetical protein U0526_00090 [Candidatus Saccharibacteria bacterium]